MHRLKAVDRCDQCGQFVSMGQLYVVDEDTGKCVCEKCNDANGLSPDEWLLWTPGIIRKVGPDNHLPFLVNLMTTIQRAGVDLSEHWDCLVEALCEEGEG